MKKNLGIVISVLVLIAVAAGVYKSYLEKQSAPQVAGKESIGLSLPGLSNPQTESVKLLVGSAKFAFLKDEELSKILAKHGIALNLVKSESFEKDKIKLAELDAVWPAGSNSAADWTATIPAATTYPVFSTPLALASWKALVPVLEANGLAKSTGAAHGDFYLDKALPQMLKGVRWNQLKDNTAFNVNKGFLVTTPDLRKSNTGALYIATLAYIENGSEVPQDAAKAASLTDKLAPLITRQGFQEETLAGPFEDYLGQGMGKAPLVLIYESQFLEAKRAGKLRDTHFLLYPQPGLVLKHIFVGKSPLGKKLGELLSTDKDIQKIAAQYGFRTNDAALFAAETKKIGLDAPDLLNLAETPTTPVLEAMTSALIRKMEGQ